MKHFFLVNLPTYLLVCIISYLFFSLCNWDIWIGDWHWFTRMLHAIVMFVGMKILLDE